jgi:glucokinase
MFIGLDIGGTKIRGGLLDRSFKVLEVVEKPTQAKKGKKIVLENIYAVIEELLRKAKSNTLRSAGVKGIGVSIRGLVDNQSGVIKKATMMPGDFRSVKLADLIKKKFKKKVVIDNDVNTFTLAESILGAGQGKSFVVGLTFGTGIGGGIVMDGKVYRGAHGAAGEMGHMIIEPNSYKWNCGQKGCFESLCSASAALKLYQDKTGEKVASLEIEQRFKAGEQSAKEVYAYMSHYLAVGLANIVHVLNPDVIVIGGGFGKLRFYIEPAKKEMLKHIVYDDLKKTQVKYAKFTKHAGLIGAALLCQETSH